MVMDEKERNAQKVWSHLHTKWPEDGIQTQNKCEETVLMPESVWRYLSAERIMTSSSIRGIRGMQTCEAKKYGPSEEISW